jgi:hypothetical protein
MICIVHGVVFLFVGDAQSHCNDVTTTFLKDRVAMKTDVEFLRRLDAERDRAVQLRIQTAAAAVSPINMVDSIVIRMY